jgi:hypothetical protein
MAGELEGNIGENVGGRSKQLERDVDPLGFFQYPKKLNDVSSCVK